MTEETDEQIAMRVQQGESERFGELIGRYQQKLLRYAGKFLFSAEDGADVVQDVFIKAYENIQSFDPSRRFSPWIYRIAHNEFVNALKKRKASRTIFTFDVDTLVPHLAASDTADSAALERDLRQMLDAHLRELDAKYREPLVLYYLEGMEYREISDILHIPVSTVGVRLARARAMLRRLAGTNPDLL
jgi:RNA polymerase sigma factor (sigma-70 family)